MITRLLFSAIIGVMPLTMMAQDDDMYFVPKKQAKQNVSVSNANSEYDRPAYYCGSSRDVDEYNRRGKLKSYYQKIGTDSLGNDIIEFHEGDGSYGVGDLDSTITIYPGSERYYDDDDDYSCSRRLGRFDGYCDPSIYVGWGRPYWRGYYGWYDPWYDPWYSYSGWYSPWYSPWGYDYWAWNYPYWGWGGWNAPYVHYSYGGPTGTRNHSAAGFGNARGAYGADGAGGRGVYNGNRVGSRTPNNGFGNRRVGTYDYSRQRDNSRMGTQRTPTNSSDFNRGNSFGGGFNGGGFGGGGRGGFGGGGRGGGFGSRR